jgi:hypothetical protein
MMSVRVPIRLESEANRRDHWGTRAGRVKEQREAVTAAFVDSGEPIHVVQVAPKKAGGKVKQVARFARQPALPLAVFITRIAPRALDDDNLVGSAKGVRDAVASLLGIDDRDPRVTWRCEHRRGGVGEYAVEIAIKPRGDS